MTRLLEGAIMDAAETESAASYDLRQKLSQARDEIAKLHEKLTAARMETAAAQREAIRAVYSLRKQLAPLYRSLQLVFGELDTIPDEHATVETGNSRQDTVWDAWKDKLGVGAGKVIDALRLHGEMNTQQLSIATGYHRNTVPQYISALNKAGLIVKNAGRFSLKRLP